MKGKIKLAVFDMAGTTVDEGNVVYKTVQQVINEQGFDVSLDQVLEYGAGKEKHQAIVDVLIGCTQATEVNLVANRAFANFKPALKRAYDRLDVKSFPGVKEAMELLRASGMFVVLNTGYDRKTASSLLEKMGWKLKADFDGLVTADDVVNGRPAPDMILQAMKLTGIEDPAFVLKAGDSCIDIEEGKNARCGVTVGVLSGAQTEEQLIQAQPDFVLASLAELPDKVLRD
ncbi:phosphonatase-like hydrolase [Lunatimonas salinarum]|uniref:phosphonatase-like hydrolase n=1 Tax=Lunatimonas salinarum TaxID=1774590 RepID=UPI001ADFE254|nr:phosphonatase-like hydrolase [Lunatimonas salinarum]